MTGVYSLLTTMMNILNWYRQSKIKRAFCNFCIIGTNMNNYIYKTLPVIIVTVLLLLIAPAYVGACSCLPEGAYFENIAKEATFIAVVSSAEVDEASERTHEGITYTDQIISFEVDRPLYDPQGLNLEGAVMSSITNYPARECGSQCSQYLNRQLGLETVIGGEAHLLMVISSIDGEYNISAILGIDEEDKLTQSFLQFGEGNELEEVIIYLKDDAIGLDIIEIQEEESIGSMVSINIVLGIGASLSFLALAYLNREKLQRFIAKK